MANYPFYVDLEANSRLNLKASSAQTLTASSAIAPNASAVDISSASNVTLTSTPTINVGVEGQWLIVNNTGSYTITLQSETQLSGTNLQLFNKTIPIPAGTPLLLQYRGTKWQQRAWGSTVANAGGYPISVTETPTDGQVLAWDASLSMYRPVSVGSTSLSPPDSSNIIAYFDASNGTKKTLDTSGGTTTVASWTDSINGYVVSQSTKNSQPFNISSGFNSLDTIRFESGKFLESASNTVLNSGNFPGSEASIIVAVRAPSNITAGSYGILRTGSSTGGYWRWGGDGNGYFDEFRNTRLEGYPATMPTSAGNYLISMRSGTGTGNYEVRLNKVSKGTQNPSWGMRSILEIGKDTTGNSWYGDILGIIIRKGASTQAIIDTENFFNTKWGMGI